MLAIKTHLNTHARTHTLTHTHTHKHETLMDGWRWEVGNKRENEEGMKRERERRGQIANE